MQASVFLIEAGRYYLMVGALVAVAFLGFGIDRVDPSARGSFAFRPLLVPGICLLWPLVLVRWVALERSAGDAEADKS
ncbi:MAG: hypothetical protein JJ902_14740 [Roseibium sp.]|nr:hypothetical protein [Roseibium sp.]